MKLTPLNPQSISARRTLFPNKSLVARLTAFLALLVLNLANFALAQQDFPSTPMDEKNLNSIAVFRVTIFSKFWPMFDGTEPPGPYTPYYGYGTSSHKFTSPALFGSVWIGLSAAHCQGAPALVSAIPGASCSPTFLPTPTASYSEISVTPPFPSGAYNEVFTYMIDMELRAGSNCATPGITQIPPPYDTFDPMVFTGPLNYPAIHKSIGQMVGWGPSSCSGNPPNYPGGYGFDLSPALPPGASFFDIYANMYIPPGPGTDIGTGFYLSNSPADPVFGAQPLIIENTGVTNLPPSPLYIHGGGLYAVAVRFVNAGHDASGNITWQAGDPFGVLTLSGHELNITCGQNLSSDFIKGVLGEPGALAPEPPPLWSFASNSFPSPGITYSSDPGTNFGGGSVDEIAFSNTLNGTVYIRSFMQGSYTSPIPPPALGTQSVYSDSSSSFACEVSLDNTNFTAVSGFGSLQYAISNTGPAGIGTLYNLTATNQTNTVSLTPFGPFLLRASLTKPSTGHHFITKSTYVASYLDMTYEYSDDFGTTWYPPSRSIRLGVSEPGCGTAGQFVSIATNNVGNLVFTWPGLNYTLQGTTNLTTPNWVNFPGASPLTLGAPTNFCRFFRVVCTNN